MKDGGRSGAKNRSDGTRSMRKVTLLMPVKTTGSSLTGGLNRKTDSVA